MKKFAMSICVAGLMTAASAQATPYPVGTIGTAAVELTCKAGSGSTGLEAVSGNYFVMDNGLNVASETLTEILSHNAAWLASVSSVAYSPSKSISSYHIPCAAAIAELQRYTGSIAYLALAYNALLPTPLAQLPISMLPTVTNLNDGRVVYNWTGAIPTSPLN